MDIKLLLKQGLSQREVSRRTGLSRNTVARVVQDPAPKPYTRQLGPSQLDPYKPYLEERFRTYGLSAVRLLEEIRPRGYTGGLHTLRRFLAPLRAARRATQRATVRFETPPGQQAQADWGYCGSFTDPAGLPFKVYAFVMVLGFSRMLFVEFTTSMALPSLLQCHQRAFEYFGGWPREVLYDNMAQVKLPHSTEWNPLFLDFAGHYGFVPHTCRVRRPRTKGKVERMVGYLKDNFLTGRSFADLPDLQAQGRHWLEHTANARLHATTGCVPWEQLASEGLTPLASLRPYPVAQRQLRKVSAEGLVHLDRCRYSVPPAHVGALVLVEEHTETGLPQVRIRLGDVVLAEHPRATRPGADCLDPQHLQALWELSVGTPPASSIPPACQSPAWELTFARGVAATPLSVYEELGA
jgi:transposase